jgi:hypothetical protein
MEGMPKELLRVMAAEEGHVDAKGVVWAVLMLEGWLVLDEDGYGGHGS